MPDPNTRPGVASRRPNPTAAAIHDKPSGLCSEEGDAGIPIGTKTDFTREAKLSGAGEGASHQQPGAAQVPPGGKTDGTRGGKADSDLGGKTDGTRGGGHVARNDE